MTGSPSRVGGDVPLRRPKECDTASPRLCCDLTERLTGTVRLPLENLEFTVAEHLLAHGTRIDPDTRLLLARVRDSIHEIAAASRGLANACAALEGAAEGVSGGARYPRTTPQTAPQTAPAAGKGRWSSLVDAF